MSRGECLLTVADQLDPCLICVAMGGDMVVAIHEGTNTFRAWDVHTLQLTCEVRLGHIS